jgi:xanthine dehydrogenase small subunit
MTSPDTTPAQAVRFLHQGKVHAVTPRAPTRTVLEWLREDARCTGTKEGCAEGDCGACMVVVGELDAQGTLLLKPVNSCIQFLPTLHGKALFTVEDVAGAGGSLHPVQQALVDHHGSQCGFCTPGFVMSLWASYQRHQGASQAPSRQQLADELSGNLCRCTGYRPILDAAQRMFDLPPAALDHRAVAAALQGLRADVPTVNLGHFHVPHTLQELAALRLAKPHALLLAGSTDVGLWVTKQFRPISELIYLGGVAELQRVEVNDSHIHIGAGACLEDAWRALAVEWPTLRDVWLRFASLPIRSVGTMGGNVANGSPIGDSAPVLMALGAQIVLRQGERVREMALDDFYVDYMKNRLEPGEFVQALRVPRPNHRGARAQQLQVYKISKRFDCDISAVCAALAIELQGEHIVDVRLAFGGMAATVRRAAVAEAALRGGPWDETRLQQAQAALAFDFTPLSDMRASAAYRLQVAQNLLRRFWLQTRAHQPMSEKELNVWAREAVP